MNVEPDKEAPNYQGETPEMLAAFQAYIAMGEKRSIKALSRQIKKAERTVNAWSKKYEWRNRLLEWQEEEKERMLAKAKEDFFRDAENLRTFKYEILNTLKKRFEVNHYCPECETPRLSISEMINILNVCKTELGEPTNITKNTAPNPNNDPFALLLARMFPPAPDADAKAN